MRRSGPGHPGGFEAPHGAVRPHRGEALLAPGAVASALARVREQEWGRLTGRLIRITGDWALAEDCVQDAFERAWQVWSRDGLPDNPAAWVTTTARNRALDRWRRARAEQDYLRRWAPPDPPETADTDERLSLIFTCCHPALPLEGRVALTLRSVAGLTTAEVARAFLTTEDTMTRRLTRARTKIQEAGIPLTVPEEALRPDRLQGVLGVLYLLFNQGNDAVPGEVERFTMAGEAVRLTRLLIELMPEDSEPRGALALMLLTLARRPARWDQQGAIVSLEFQDRSLWDRGRLTEGLAVLEDAASLGTGPYTLQAAIAGCHGRAAAAKDTDFAAIAGLYARLEALSPSPVIRLNRAVAIGLAEGPGVGLALVETLVGEPSVARYHLLHAVRADFLKRLGRAEEAVEAYRKAEDLAPGEAEKRFLAKARAEVEGR